MSSKLKLKCLLTLSYKYTNKQVIKTYYGPTVLMLANEILDSLNPFNSDIINENCANNKYFKVYELIDDNTNAKLYFNVQSSTTTNFNRIGTTDVIFRFREFIFKNYHYDLNDYVILTVSDSINRVIFNRYYLSFLKLKQLIQEFIIYYPNANGLITLENETRPKIINESIVDQLKLYKTIEVLPKDAVTLGKHKHSLVTDINKCEELQYNDTKLFQLDSLMLINLRNEIIDTKDLIILIETIDTYCKLSPQQSSLITEVKEYYCKHGTFNGFKYSTSELADLLLTILSY